MYQNNTLGVQNATLLLEESEWDNNPTLGEELYDM